MHKPEVDGSNSNLSVCCQSVFASWCLSCTSSNFAARRKVATQPTDPSHSSLSPIAVDMAILRHFSVTTFCEAKLPLVLHFMVDHENVT